MDLWNMKDFQTPPSPFKFMNGVPYYKKNSATKIHHYSEILL